MAVDVQEEARLIGGVDPAESPDHGVEREVAHVGSARHPVDTAHADEREHGGRGFVVRALDHRVDQAVVGGRQRPVAHARVVEVGDEQHRLQHARRGDRTRGAPAPFALYGAHVEADDAGARVGVGDRRVDPRLPLGSLRGGGGGGGHGEDRAEHEHAAGHLAEHVLQSFMLRYPLPRNLERGTSARP